MKTSTNISNLTKALLKAQSQMGAAKKDAKNPFFKSSYADLPTVMEVVKGPLNEAGIVVLQPASHQDGKNFITTTLIHGESGEWMSSETEVVSAKANDPQAFGAAQTYARRFGLQAMLFIPAEDDDGNTAAGRTTKITQQTKTTGTTSVGAVTLPSVNVVTTNSQNQEINVNAEFDAIPAPIANIEPLKKSTFRKNNTQTQAVSVQSSDAGGWD